MVDTSSTNQAPSAPRSSVGVEPPGLDAAPTAAPADESHLAPEDRSSWPPPDGEPVPVSPPSVQPLVVPAATEPPSLARWPAWVIAVSPVVLLVALLVAVWFDPNDTWLSGRGLLTATWLAVAAFPVWDAWRVGRAGHGGLMVWALLLPPVYLFLRQRRIGQSLLPGFAMLATYVVYVVGAVVLPGVLFGVPLDMTKVEDGMTAKVAEVTGLPGSSITTTCPQRVWYHVGDTFDCSVTDTVGDRTTLRATVLSTSGDISYRGVTP